LGEKCSQFFLLFKLKALYNCISTMRESFYVCTMQTQKSKDYFQVTQLHVKHLTKVAV
jgi:hypothetical protein